MTPTRYPLAWPAGRPRAKTRKYGHFHNIKDNGRYKQKADLTIAEAMDRLDGELERMGARNVILSSNLDLKLDGRPRSGQPAPADPGVCVFFTYKAKQVAMPCDTFTKAEQNIAALAATIAAQRAIERYGVITTEDTLMAFTALPAPSGAPVKRDWWVVFGLMRETATKDAVNTLYRVISKRAAGDEARQLELNLARDEAMKELS